MLPHGILVRQEMKKLYLSETVFRLFCSLFQGLSAFMNRPGGSAFPQRVSSIPMRRERFLTFRGENCIISAGRMG